MYLQKNFNLPILRETISASKIYHYKYWFRYLPATRMKTWNSQGIVRKIFSIPQEVLQLADT